MALKRAGIVEFSSRSRYEPPKATPTATPVVLGRLADAAADDAIDSRRLAEAVEASSGNCASDTGASAAGVPAAGVPVAGVLPAAR